MCRFIYSYYLNFFHFILFLSSFFIRDKWYRYYCGLHFSRTSWLASVPKNKSLHLSRTSWLASAPTNEILTNVFYVHVPKAGSSFQNVLIHYFCNISDDVTTSGGPNQFMMDYGERCSPHSFARFDIGHEPVDAIKTDAPIVTMLRDPYERILSGFYYGLHDCNEMNKGRGHKMKQSYFNQADHSNINFLKRYINCVQHCQIKMFLERPCGDSIKPGEFDINHILDSITFFGLQDRWPVSVCLFHSLFGGECKAIEFKNSRPAIVNKHFTVAEVREIAEELEVDYDHKFFQLAHDKFWKLVDSQNLDPKECERICPFRYTSADFHHLEKWIN